MKIDVSAKQSRPKLVIAISGCYITCCLFFVLFMWFFVMLFASSARNGPWPWSLLGLVPFVLVGLLGAGMFFRLAWGFYTLKLWAYDAARGYPAPTAMMLSLSGVLDRPDIRAAFGADVRDAQRRENAMRITKRAALIGAVPALWLALRMLSKRNRIK